MGVTKTAKFMKQSGSQGDSECRHDGSHRLEASRLGWVREDEREGGRRKEGEKRQGWVDTGR